MSLIIFFVVLATIFGGVFGFFLRRYLVKKNLSNAEKLVEEKLEKAGKGDFIRCEK